MKTLYTFCFAVLVILAQQAMGQIPNSSFEDWASGDPVDWETSNGPGFTPITQSGDSFEGDYSVSIKGAQNGGFQIGGFVGTQLFPIDFVPENLVGWYKPMLISNDEVVTVIIVVTDSNDEAVASGVGSLQGNTGAWDQFEVSLFSITANAPAACTISFQLNNTIDPFSLNPESEMLVDQLGLDGVTHLDVVLKPTFNVYPNPAKDQFSIDTRTISAKSIRIVDSKGATVLSEANFNEGLVTLDVSDLEGGMYYIVIETDTAILTERILLE